MKQTMFPVSKEKTDFKIQLVLLSRQVKTTSDLNVLFYEFFL